MVSFGERMLALDLRTTVDLHVPTIKNSTETGTYNVHRILEHLPFMNWVHHLDAAIVAMVL